MESDNTKLHIKCIRCGRILKSEINRLRGMGETCWKKSQHEKKVKSLF